MIFWIFVFFRHFKIYVRVFRKHACVDLCLSTRILTWNSYVFSENTRIWRSIKLRVYRGYTYVVLYKRTGFLNFLLFGFSEITRISRIHVRSFRNFVRILTFKPRVYRGYTCVVTGKPFVFWVFRVFRFCPSFLDIRTCLVKTRVVWVLCKRTSFLKKRVVCLRKYVRVFWIHAYTDGETTCEFSKRRVFCENTYVFWQETRVDCELAVNCPVRCQGINSVFGINWIECAFNFGIFPNLPAMVP